MLKVVHLSCSDAGDGSARAAYRIHKALQESLVDSRMFVNRKNTNDPSVLGPRTRLEGAIKLLRPVFASLVQPIVRSNNTSLHTLSILPSSWPRIINMSDIDILHIHGIYHEMFSIGDFAKVKKPILWTLHDMWAFCGAEHLANDARFIDGYRKSNRPSSEKGFDFNRFTWNRKKRLWLKAFDLVCPSHWLAECARASALMNGWPISIIPNALDTHVWKPIDRSAARELLDLPHHVPLVLFGASSATSDYNKGFDLLVESLRALRLMHSFDSLQLIVFGGNEPLDSLNIGFPVRFIGRLHDDLSLRAYYSAADVFLVPSRLESFCQTASEAHACGTPVVAFSSTGLKDVVEHQETGYLAQPYDTRDFAAGISWCLADRVRHTRLCDSARRRAEKLWNPSRVAQMYMTVYQKLLDRDKTTTPLSHQ